MIRLQNCPLQLLSNTQDQGPRDSTHATQACTQNTLAMWETTKAHVYQQTLGFTQYQNNLVQTYGFAKVCTPKQSRNRPMVILQSVPSTKTIS